VLALSPELEVTGQTLETEDYLRILVPSDSGRQPIPAGVYSVAAQLLAVESGVDDHPPFTRVQLTGGHVVDLRAARIGGSTSGDERNIAVSIEPTSPAERTSLYVRAYGLSAREAELVAHLASGADIREAVLDSASQDGESAKGRCSCSQVDPARQTWTWTSRGAPGNGRK
jgi:hypothetical protein